jgi:hypothetical protein
MFHFTSRLWALSVSLLFVYAAQGQIVLSSCSFDQSFYNKYSPGTWNSAYTYLNDLDSVAFTMQPNIPQALHDTILASIAAVYNTSLPARDTVFAQLDIAQFQPVDLLRFDLRLDTSHGWVNQFLSGNTTATSNNFVNDLAQQFGFSLELVQYMPAWVQTHDAEARVRIASPHNTNAIARILAMQSGVLTANAVAPSGDGNQIIYDKESDYHVLTFRYGWEDCPAGCVYQRDWRFRVFQDCSVEFVASYGDLLGTTAVAPLPAATQFAVSPNPAQQFLQLTISDADAAGTYQLRLIDIHGKLIYDSTQDLHEDIPFTIRLNGVESGIYILQIEHERGTISRKIMVNN